MGVAQLIRLVSATAAAGATLKQRVMLGLEKPFPGVKERVVRLCGQNSDVVPVSLARCGRRTTWTLLDILLCQEPFWGAAALRPPCCCHWRSSITWRAGCCERSGRRAGMVSTCCRFLRRWRSIPPSTLRCFSRALRRVASLGYSSIVATENCTTLPPDTRCKPIIPATSDGPAADACGGRGQ